MLDVAWPELIVIGAVALVAVGPKDLPKMMFKLGQGFGKLRRFAGQIQRGLEQLNYEAEAAERAKTVKPEVKTPPSAPVPPVAEPEVKRDA